MAAAATIERAAVRKILMIAIKDTKRSKVPRSRKTWKGIIRIHVAGIAQGLERLSVEEEAAGSRPAIRPKRLS